MPLKSKSVASTVVDVSAMLTMQWVEELTVELRRRVLTETKMRRVKSGAFVCQKGEPVLNWFGVIDGLVKISSVSRQGKTVGFTGIPSGGWFGEGSLLKNEPRRYDAVALRD